MIKYLSIFIFLVSCSPHSPEDYNKEGEALVRKLTYELEAVHSREELVMVMPKVKKIFHEIVDLMIAAKSYKENNPDMIPLEPTDENLFLNESLKFELKRMYRLEGGKEIIEKAQREELIRLDAAFFALHKKQLKSGGGSQKIPESKKGQPRPGL